MAILTIIVESVTITLLYKTALDEEKLRLVETAKSQASLIDAIARFDEKYSNNYPELPYHEVSLPVWKMEDTEDFIISRLEGLKQAKEAYSRTGRLPMCTDKERWVREKKWAVTKKGNKKASRCFDNCKDAYEYMNKMNLETKYTYLVAERKVKYPRCEKWCSVSRWCSQIKEI